MNQTELRKGIDGRDALDNEGGEVTALLSALPRVEAPGNFEFGVRSRIAARKQVKPRGILTPFLKVVAPLALILGGTGFVFFYGTMEPADTPQIANLQEAAPPAPVAVMAQASPVDQPNSEVVGEPVQPNKGLRAQGSPGPVRAIRNSRRQRGRSIDSPMMSPGSLDTALGSSKTILPRGFNANIGSTSEVPVKEVLGILGVSSEFVDGTCRVRSVTDNSLGARAGVKTGDVIETVDGRAIKSYTKLNGVSGGKTFGVRRDGKRLNLTIGN